MSSLSNTVQVAPVTVNTDNSTTLVSTSNGLPIVDSYLSPVVNTWSSATSLNTAVSMSTAGMDIVALTIQTSGVVTTGAITFEVYDGANWVVVKCARASSYNTDSTYSMAGFSGTTIQGWTVPASGFPQFRYRLSTAITGAGTVLVTTIVSSAPDTSVVTAGLDPLQSLHPGAKQITNVQSLAVGSSSAQSSVVASTTNRVTLVSTTACWVNLGSSPTAVVAAGTTSSGASIYLPANFPMPDMFVTAGVTKIAAIQASAAGVLSIIESQ